MDHLWEKCLFVCREETYMIVPNHIAIILDGNGRWAREKRMPRSYGHVKGCENLENICTIAKEVGIKYLTVYAFSTENWKRPPQEVEELMRLFRNYMKKCLKIAKKNRMRVRVIGDTSAFDEDLREGIRKLEEFSKDYKELYFQIALNYGSRDEIARAVQKMLRAQEEGKLKAESVTPETITGYLDTAGIPDPDLLIRTSGEERLSNFLLWQLAYTEFYFTDVAWPEFGKKDLVEAIEKYNNRDRRYGDVGEE
jgi:undecaprenyl diphosphate synthase